MSNSNVDKPLEPAEVATDDDCLGPADEGEDKPGLHMNADRENQASTEKMDPGKFQRD